MSKLEDSPALAGLSTAAKHLAAIVDRSPAIVFLWRFQEDFPVEFVTQNVRLLGYTPEDFYTGRVSWVAITYPDDEPRLRAEVDGFLTSGQDSFAQEYRLYTGDGHLRWIEDRNLVLRNDTGEITHIQGVVMDITARKRTEAALHASRESFHSIVERSAEGILIASAAGQLLFRNRAALTMLDAAILDKLLYRLTEPAPPPEAAELPIRRTNGTPGVGEWSAVSTTWEGMAAWLVTLRDVTIRRRAQQQVADQQALAVRSDRLRALGEMATGIAHEINQPLTGIRTYAEHLLLGMQRGWNAGPAAFVEKLRGIVDQVDRMERIVQHVRLYARDPGRIHCEPTDVNQVVSNSLGLLAVQLESRGIRHETRLAAGLPSVDANPYSLEEVMLNLLANARDALGDVDRARPPAKADLLLRTRLVDGPAGPCVAIHVVDRGSGIAAGDMPHVYEAFFTTKSPEQGTGIGLTISKGIVDQFGGSLRLASRLGKGTVVSICLPAISHSPSQAAADALL